MNEEAYHYNHQLEMDYHQDKLASPPPITVPQGYHIRHYQAGDERTFYALMHAVGWTQWNDTLLVKWMDRILPGSWFMVIHTETEQLVASALCAHSHTDYHPMGGEIGWIATHPDHRGQGLGTLVTGSVTRRLIDMGYQHIHLYTEDFRLPAIKIYLSLGYVPFLYLPEMTDRWRAVCDALAYPFTPDQWRKR
ncbi:MAG: GNAT family N-acetyltransferase [Anaerolineae bacterium]